MQGDQRSDVVWIIPVVGIKIRDSIEALPDRGSRADQPRRVAGIGVGLFEHDVLGGKGRNPLLWFAIGDQYVSAGVLLGRDAAMTVLQPLIGNPEVGCDDSYPKFQVVPPRESNCERDKISGAKRHP